MFLHARSIFFTAFAVILLSSPLVADAVAPFGDSFDSYAFGSLYGQGLWQNNQHVWQVGDTGCINSTGRCISSTGVNSENWKSGTDLAQGEWHLSFFVASPFSFSYVGPSIYFGSQAHPSGQSLLNILNDTGNTIKIVDNHGTLLASGLSFGAWHSLVYKWDMSDPHNCSFAASIDGGPDVPSTPGFGGGADCYGDVYAEHTIGALGLSTYHVNPGQFLIDDISNGPVVTGCMVNCSPTTTPQITDTFENFNSNGWDVLNEFTKNFEFDDGSTGNCHTGSCVIGETTYTTTVPAMYWESGVGLDTGAYTLWARASNGSWIHGPTGALSLCTSAFSHCTEYNYTFTDNIPLDNTWHQYSLAWRQGVSSVEACIVRDSTDFTNCNWVDTGLALGTQFDGLALWSQNGYRSDLGQNIWFDDLAPLPPPHTCTSECFSNVLFLPGVEASRLYRPNGVGEKRLWEPSSDADAAELVMNPDGTSMRPDVYTRDILDNAYVPAKGNVYASFIADMNALTAKGTINAWEAAPYDWRLSLEDILTHGAKNGSNISYLTATDTPYIVQELKRLAASSKTGKVTLIAHSNGGLVAKALMQKLGNAATAEFIDKVIFVASPQVGTPGAIAGLLHGYQQGLPTSDFPYALSAKTTRVIGDTMPGLYGLLPSASYFTYVDDPVATFATSTMSDWITRYGVDNVHSQDRLHAFLTDIERTLPSTNDLLNPTILSGTVLSQAESMHQSLDSWTPPSGVKVIQIAGWGIPITVSGIDYVRTLNDGVLTVAPFPRFVIDGDGTVVVPSALWVSTTTGAVDYWVNLTKYNSLLDKITTGHLFKVDHASILEIRKLLDFIDDSITNTTKSLSDYNYFSTETPSSAEAHLRYSLHSPLSLNLYDGQGHHTGISTTTGEIDEQIPGTYYTEFAGVKYVFTDEFTPVSVVMNGYASGTFAFNVDEYQGNTSTASTAFVDVPTTASTTATITTGSGVSSLSPLTVDENGDGTPNYILAPAVNGISQPGTTTPVTVAAITGTVGKNGWYTSDVTVSLNANDSGSGIKTTYYSLDGQATTTGTSLNISGDGIHTLSYFSQNNAGNIEVPKTLRVKIDTTPPEGVITFDPNTKAVTVSGTDALSLPSVITGNASSTITDAAGHTLKIVYSKFTPTGKAIVNIAKLIYDGVTMTIPSNSLTYSWTSQKGSSSLVEKSKIFHQSCISGSYSSKTASTTLYVNTSGDTCPKTVTTTTVGLDLISEQTNKGLLKVNY